ncbi:hypothetical protein MNBD_GAMMA01-259 [hydrothermal vent metagenome]|uniref:Uncharacterized protein n=1 Tax=hydrothermal vent metagenome TaxID=652676 RepID=A0A3B0VMP5_9ZZZZ
MNKKELTKMAKEFAKNIKTTDDLTSLTSMLAKQVTEAALGAEMEEHLGYSKNQQNKCQKWLHTKNTQRLSW